MILVFLLKYALRLTVLRSLIIVAFLMIAAADVLLRRHEQYLSSNKECLTPAVEVCQGGKAHGFQEVTVSGTIIC